MLRRILQFGEIALLVAGTVIPLLEFFDRWDATSGLTTDTELCVAAVLLGLGIAFSVLAPVRILPSLASAKLFIGLNSGVLVPLTHERNRKIELGPSPPLILRI